MNNDAITLMEVQESIVAAKQDNRSAMPADEELAKEFLGRLIDMRLQLQEADREKIIVDEAEVDEELTRAPEEVPGHPHPPAVRGGPEGAGPVAGRLSSGAFARPSAWPRWCGARSPCGSASTTRRSPSTWRQNRGKLEQGLPYHARNILIVPDGDRPSDAAWEAARIRADVIRQQIVAGADFAEMARQHSRDASAKDGGDLGTLKRGELAVDIENEILRLAPGEISQPYRSSLGYHLFKLESKDTLDGAGLERARQQIREILFREKYEARLDAWLKEIKQRAIIEVRL